MKQSYRGTTGRLLLLALALFVSATNAFVIAGLLPEIAAALGATPAAVSYSITSYALVVAVASPLVSITLARVPRTLLMTAGVAVFALGTAIATAGGTLTLFFLGRSLSGLGAAALVPTATAAAAALAAPERRGRALALVGAGFTLAIAVGAPVGTALGGAAGWRLPMWILVAAGAVLAVVLPFAVRKVPLGPLVPLRQRTAPLADRRILAPLGTTLLMVAAFNVVYIFSAAVTEPATGGSSALLAALLLAFGLAGMVGTLVAGPAADRFGSRPTAVLALAVQGVALVALSLVERSYVGSMVVFAVWGVAAFATTIPVQHRLVDVAPDAAGITLSWFSTAMYLGIALAPPLGAATVAAGGPAALPITGAVVSATALAVFLSGFARRGPARPVSPGHRAARAARR